MPQPVPLRLGFYSQTRSRRQRLCHPRADAQSVASQRDRTIYAAAAAAATQPQISWDQFPNYLGEGIRSRLLGLATLHLLKPGRYPAAVKEMPSNSNKVLLGGPPSCELYQERVIRWVCKACECRDGAVVLWALVQTFALDGIGQVQFTHGA